METETTRSIPTNSSVGVGPDLVEQAPPQGLEHAPPISVCLSQGTNAVQDVDTEASTRTEQHRQLVSYGTKALVAATCLVIAGIVGFVLGNRGESGFSFSAPAPVMARSESPSSAPTIYLDLFLEDLPPSTLRSLQNFSTPQWKAYDWLSHHPDLDLMAEWRKTQLFALGTFFYSFGGPHWKDEIRNDWMLYTKSECLWFSSEFGVFIDEGGYEQRLFGIELDPCNEQNQYQSINLQKLGAAEHQPVLPPEIALLTSLAGLVIPLNDLNVSLADWVPFELYRMSNLQVLSFQQNQFHGTIPSEFGLMTNLQRLWFPFNSLSGPIPSELGLMTSLFHLDIANNPVSEVIPSEFGLLTNLSYLRLHGTHLTGSIPSEFFQMTSMVEINLSGNYLTGTIPMELAKMTDLIFLIIFDNQLSGPIPSEIGLLTRLREVYFLQNALTSTVPTEMGQLAELFIFHTAVNAISGTIPLEISGLSAANLQISVALNSITGSIPNELAQMKNLETIWMQYNSLTGTIPQDMGSAANASLTGFFVERNSLSGSVPELLCELGPCQWDVWYCVAGLHFDCNDELCGCDWCECAA